MKMFIIALVFSSALLGLSGTARAGWFDNSKGAAYDGGGGVAQPGSGMPAGFQSQVMGRPAQSSTPQQRSYSSNLWGGMNSVMNPYYYGLNR